MGAKVLRWRWQRLSCLSVLAVATANVWAQSAPGGEPRRGTVACYTRVVECVLPLGDEPATAWNVAVRAERAFSPEWTVILEEDQQSKYRAVLTQPRGFRLGDRVMNDRSEGPCGECADWRNHLDMQRCIVTEKDVPELRRLANQFSQQRWPAVPNAGIVFDATAFTILVRSQFEEYRLKLQGPPFRRPRDRWHPVVAWTDDVYRAVSQAPSCQTH